MTPVEWEWIKAYKAWEGRRLHMPEYRVLVTPFPGHNGRNAGAIIVIEDTPVLGRMIVGFTNGGDEVKDIIGWALGQTPTPIIKVAGSKGTRNVLWDATVALLQEVGLIKG